MATFRKKFEEYFSDLNYEEFQRQEKAVNSAIQVLRESANGFRNLKGAKRSRHRSAFRIFSNLLGGQDQNQARINFVYCSCCFSPSQLGTIAHKASFLEDFQRWTQEVTFPAAFVTTVQRLYRQHQAILDQHMQHGAKRKPSEDESSAEAAEKRQACVQTCLASCGSDGEVSHREGAEFVDAPFSGPVYVLEAVDVIRAVVAEDNEKPGFKLTMPDFPGHSPFITFNCPPSLANALLQKRAQIL